MITYKFLEFHLKASLKIILYLDEEIIVEILYHGIVSKSIYKVTVLNYIILLKLKQFCPF